ncbi:transcription factor TFIIF complex subunit Tfg3, variant 2 [Entomophthora muscae]|uniref:Transcription factor TFIIF complex subunit Tfg3, variant 2 n=1 Tax=Entomophthora muscae TaxID=34485 RepID=A0ACC2U8W2_9FUNG|nr:transcription factor TFIIF complex subunit Tfg3, variant 2 [Entomophthora muscae]
MNRSVEKRIVVTTRSKMLPEKNRETNTPMYSWRVSISALDAKGKYQENLPFISHVEFKLHETFPKPRHFVHSAPFQIQERGWGSFDMFITLHFVDSAHKPHTIAHDLHFKKSEYKVSQTVPFYDVTDDFYQLLHSSEAEEVSPASSRHSHGAKTVRSSVIQKPKPLAKGPSKTKPRSVPDSHQKPSPISRQPKPASHQLVSRPPKPSSYQPTVIPRPSRPGYYQPTTIPRPPKPTSSSPPRVEKRRRAPEALPKTLRGKSSSTSPDDVMPPTKVPRKNPIANPKSAASSVTPPSKVCASFTSC